MGLPNNYQPKVPERKEFELLPDDTYEVEITKMEFKENQPVYQKEGEFEDKLNFEFTIVEESEFKGRKMWQETRIVMSAGSKGYSPSWLYKLFCAVNRANLTDEEAKGVAASDINDMLNKRVRLVVKTEPNRKGEMKNKIKDMLPVKNYSTNNTLPQVDKLQEQINTQKPASIAAADEIDVDGIPF